MVVGIMVVGAVVAVSTMNAPVSDSEGFKSGQEHLVQDALDTLAAQPSRDDSHAIFGSLLEEYVLKAVAGDRAPLMDYLNRTLPSGSQYNVFLDTGFGRPINVVAGGSPSGESQAGATNFVPKMSYVFMVPEFQSYQDDFHMNVLAMPMHNSLIQRDEGETVELAITYSDGGDKATQKITDRTALRFNDPDGRSWPSTSLYTRNDEGEPSYFYDPGDLVSHFLDEDDLTGSLLGVSTDTLDLDEVYNVTFPIEVEESAGHPIPRGAKFSMELPRGWYISPGQMDWMENSDEAGNAELWTDFEWNGTSGEGWTISARLKDPLKSDNATFMFSGDYGLMVDSAYPHFHPIVTWMGEGAQGRSTILVDVPADVDVGGFRRDTYISLAKPMISDVSSTWGMSFANMADALDGDVTIDKVEIIQPEGHRIFSDVNHTAGWEDGTWTMESPGHAVWTPSGGSGVAAGAAAWLSMKVTGGSTGDNHYRNHDYQELMFNYSPNFTESGSSGNWSFSKRANHMGTDSVYRQLVPPFEDSGYPGWPDEADSYWFTADAQQRNRYATGNSSYDVSSASALAQAFGDYQGDHVFSEIDLEDPYGEARRNFEVGERVHVKNDFSALFNSLTDIRDDTGLFDDLDIQNVHMTTSVFTPEKAWTGQPTKVFREDVNLDSIFGQFDWMFPTDLTGNNIQDAILVGSDGLVYGLDGRDGSRLWKIDSFKTVDQATLSDVTGDGKKELVIAASDNKLYAYNTQMNIATKDRGMWSLSMPTAILDGGVSPHEVSALLDLSSVHATDDGAGPKDPVLAVALSASSGASYVALVHPVEKSGGWDAVLGAKHKSSGSTTDNVRITDLVAAAHPSGSGDPEMTLAVSSMNRTVTLLSVSDMKPLWVTKTPERPFSLTAGDLSGDGYEDIVVNTGVTSSTDSGGDFLYVLPGKTGILGPAPRDLGMLEDFKIRPYSAEITKEGHAAVAGDHRDVLQDATGLYAPNVDGLPVGGCELEVGIGTTQQMAFQGVSKDLEDVYDWLQERSWVGTFVESTADDETIYLVARDGSVVRTVQPCDGNRFEWEVVDGTSLIEDAESEYEYMDLHAHRPMESDGTLHRMTWNGTVERRVGEVGDWTTLVDLCDETVLALCADEMEVGAWQVEEDESGDAERIWAAGWMTQTSDDDVDWDAFLVSASIEDLLDETVTQPWDFEVEWKDVALTAMHMEDDGRIWLGGGHKNDTLFMAYREGPGEAFVEQDVVDGIAGRGGYDFDVHLKFNHTKAPPHTVLDFAIGGDDQAWALDPQGQAWRHASQGHWILYPTRAGATSVGSLATDPEGTVWAFFDDYRHMPLHTHAPSAQVELGSFVAGSSGTALTVEVTTDEGNLYKHPDDPEPITDLKWYARPAGGDDWTRLDDNLLKVGGGDYSTTLSSASSMNAVELKVVLESRTLSSDHEVVQDAGMSPVLRSATVTVESASHELDVVDAAGSSQDTFHSEYYGGMVLEVEQPGWGYRGGRNLGSDLHQGVNVRHVGLGQMTNSTTTLDVGIVERGNQNVQWWVFDGETGVPVRPTSGTESISGSGNFIDQLLVGDLTGDGIDNMATLGYFGDEKRLAYLWDTQNNEWHHIDAEENLVIPSAALTGTDRGRKTVSYALPGKTITAGMEVYGVSSGEQAHFIESWFGPLDETDPSERWSTAPLASQGFTTFNYEIPKNAMFGTSQVLSEMTFDVVSDNHSVTQTARLVDWFDILPPGRSESVPPVYTVEVVAWFDEGGGRSERISSDPSGDGSGDGITVDPDLEKFNQQS